jgi:uroporphyrinogen decarboxylase
MNTKQWIVEVINAPKRIAIPILTHPGIEMIGKTVQDAVTDGRVHAEAILALNERYPSASASTVIMDLTVEAEAFGCSINFSKDEAPTVSHRLLSSYEEVQQLAVPPLSAGRVPHYLLANQLAAAAITDKPVFGGCIGPYSLAGRLFDMTEIMIAIYIEPDTIHLLLKKCTQLLIEYCRALKATGINGIIIAEPASGLLSDDDCRQFSSAYVKQIVDALQDDHFSMILHNCGNTGNCTQAMLYAGAHGYHFGNAVNMVNVLETCPPDVLVIGNLDPVGVFKLSTPKQVKQSVKTLLEQTASYKNFVLSSGCDIPPHTPLENVDAFYEALAAYNSSK